MPYVDPGVQSRLNACKSQQATLRSQRNTAKDALDGARAATQALGANGNVNLGDIQTTPEFQRLQRAQKAASDIEVQLASLEEEERFLLSRIAGVDTQDRESFMSDPNVMARLAGLAGSTAPIGGDPRGGGAPGMELGTLISRDELLASWDNRRSMMAAAGDVTIPSTARQTTYYGIVPQLRRRLRLLDLIPSSPMDSGNSFDYSVESGSLDTAAETVEAALKPTGVETLTDAQVVAQTIAHWVKIPKQQLSDIPSLTTTLQQRLVYGVERRLENQIIGGSGTGANLTGIINTSGIGAPASVVGDVFNADLTLNAIGAILSSEAEPNAVCLNPADIVKMAKSKASGTGQRMADIQTDLISGNLTLWGVPVISSTAIASGHVLVGDFTLGARVYVREGVNVTIGNDSDDFTRNRVTMLGEGRFGLAVYQPAAFAYIPLSFAA
jgi:HK97 family phage major capsid protein